MFKQWTNFWKKVTVWREKMVENHKLLGLDCEGEKRVQNRLERKEKELIGF
jgi:hypothetical protein